jgi:hypothetical protein
VDQDPGEPDQCLEKSVVDTCMENLCSQERIVTALHGCFLCAAYQLNVALWDSVREITTAAQAEYVRGLSEQHEKSERVQQRREAAAITAAKDKSGGGGKKQDTLALDWEELGRDRVVTGALARNSPLMELLCVRLLPNLGDVSCVWGRALCVAAACVFVRR